MAFWNRVRVRLLLGRSLSRSLRRGLGSGLRRSLGRSLGRRLGRSLATAARITIAIAVAAAMAAAVATRAIAVAAASVVTAVAAVAAAAALAAIAARAAAGAAVATMASNGLVLTADEGDANDREKHRDPEHNKSIHPKFLQLRTGTVSEIRFNHCRLWVFTPNGTANRWRSSDPPGLNVLPCRAVPCCKDLPVRKTTKVAKVRTLH